MQIISSPGHENATRVGWGVRVLLMSSEGETGVTSHRLASLGGQVEVEAELFSALAALIDDPAGYGLFVMECDGENVGGLAAGRRAVQMLGDVALRVPVILVSRECAEQGFRNDRSAPILLRAPVTPASLRVGFERALHDRLFYHAA